MQFSLAKKLGLHSCLRSILNDNVGWYLRLYGRHEGYTSRQVKYEQVQTERVQIVTSECKWRDQVEMVQAGRRGHSPTLYPPSHLSQE